MTIHRAAGEGRGSSLFLSTVSTRSRTYRNLFVVLQLRWIPSMFNFSECNYHTLIYEIYQTLTISIWLNIKVELSTHIIVGIIWFNWSTLEMIQNTYFSLNAVFILNIFNFLSWLFLSCWEMDWWENQAYCWNLCCHNLRNKQLLYTYRPTYQEVKTFRQWNLPI